MHLRTSSKPRDFNDVGSQDKSVNRLVNKDGSYDVRQNALRQIMGRKRWKRNVFNVILEIQWRYIVSSMIILFPLSWTIFALMFYSAAKFHGDFDEVDGENRSYSSLNDSYSRSEQPCVKNVYNFWTMLLFSIESQETVGYGNRYNTEECYSLIIMLCLQYVFGAVLQACLSAIIWARLLRPKSRGQEVIFSEAACIYYDDKDYNFRFAFRLSDINGTHLVQSGVRLYLAKKSKSDDFSFRLCHLQMGEDTGRDKVFFLWPTVAYHVINQQSPLFEIDRGEFEKANFEFIVVAEGIVESTGLTVQTRTSYLPSEVHWGYRFAPMNFGEKNDKNCVTIKYDDFNSVFTAETPKSSPNEWNQVRNRRKIDFQAPNI